MHHEGEFLSLSLSLSKVCPYMFQLGASQNVVFSCHVLSLQASGADISLHCAAPSPLGSLIFLSSCECEFLTHSLTHSQRRNRLICESLRDLTIASQWSWTAAHPCG